MYRAASTVGKVARATTKGLAGAAAVDYVLDYVADANASNAQISRDQLGEKNEQADQGELQQPPIEPGKPLPDPRANPTLVQTEKNNIQETKSVVTSGNEISNAQTNQGRFVLHNLALWRSDAMQPPIDPPISVSDLKTNEVNNYPTNASLINLNPAKKQKR